MGLLNLFKNKSKQYSVRTQLNGNTAKGRQELLGELAQNHIDLKPRFSLNNGTLTISVYAKNMIGTVDSKIVREIEKSYGDSCNLSIGQNYEIQKNAAGELVCVVNLAVND